MVQRLSGYARQPLDAYNTPSWVTKALLKYETFRGPVWEPASGDGDMVDALAGNGFVVHGSDIVDGTDFLKVTTLIAEPGTGLASFRDIITNPPFSQAEAFVRHAIKLTQPVGGKVAMLLPAYFDNAKTRIGLFRNHPFKIKYILTQRIRWPNLVQKSNGPSTNHCWYIWDWGNNMDPKIWWI